MPEVFIGSPLVVEMPTLEVSPFPIAVSVPRGKGETGGVVAKGGIVVMTKLPYPTYFVVTVIGVGLIGIYCDGTDVVT